LIDGDEIVHSDVAPPLRRHCNATVDHGTVLEGKGLGEILSEKLIECLESGDFGPLADRYAPDAVLDCHVPNWRFQVQGPDAIAANFRGWWPVAGRVIVQRAQELDTGVLVQFERWSLENGDELSTREVHILDLTGGRITDHVVFCAGKFTPELRAQMAVEAPLIRP